ncbi:hypothetical protein [Alistipes sp.]|uniref:hypothetical protein n=1 Tax=Alistipes sp. TaxID=1872444 RepID=UPI003AB56EF6
MKSATSKRLACILALAALGFLLPPKASAQYYTWGSDPASLRWSAIRTPDVRIIYPDTAAFLARRTLRYIEAVRPTIGYGFRHGPMRIPFVMHPENFESNGLVMWLPKRVEFLTSPAVASYSMPWYKQLVAHEYRHAVQYNNLNRGVIRALSYVLGQQGSTIGLLCLPIWLMEGDAVMSETEMSSFGRGLQPSFTLEYRAMGDIAGRRRNPDLWFCGSYREFIPDHYRLGYQIASYSYTRFGENIWDRVAWYGSRNPYLFFTTSISLKKFYGTSVNRLFRETFDDLRGFWDALPQTADSAMPLTELPPKNHTSYTYPMASGAGSLVALKTDFDRPSRLVRLDRASGREERLAYTGYVSSRPAMDPQGRIWWTEYRRSLLFEQRVNSRLCYADLAGGRPRTVRGHRNVLYPTPVDSAGLAWVEYNPDGRYVIVRRRPGWGVQRYEMERLTELHGLAWDNATGRLYFLVTDDSGMWIGTLDDFGRVRHVTEGAYVTLSDLRAADGRLYFGSIASGKDEAHCLDLGSGRQYRLTSSRYGSFSPSPDAQGDVLVTTYDRRGYRPAVQPFDTLHPVAYARLPRNTVNPPRLRWPVVNLDTVSYTPADSAASHARHRARRYPKALTLIKIHSWTPVAFNPFEAVDEHNVSLNLGVTLLSQNLLSNTEAFASYGWNDAEGSLFRIGVRYFGLGVRFDLEGAYGGNQSIYSLAQIDPQTGKPEYQKRPSPDKYYSVGATATLPLVFQRGYHTRQLSLSAGWNFSNGMVANVGRIRYDEDRHTITNLEYIGYKEGLHKLSFGAAYSDAVRTAHRDFLPRWGYQLSASYALNPTNRKFSDLVSLYGRIYLPGFLPHNAVIVALSYQTSIGGFKFPSGQSFLGYKSTRLLPRGFSSADIRSNNYTAASVDYQFPLCYPEGGIPSVLYFKRIRLGLGADYAQFRDLAPHGRMRWERIWSIGGDLILDVNAFRQPASATSTVKLSFYRPSTGGLSFSVGVGLPF